ncbi:MULTISPECIES: TetR/AcrR family transcriptional regulator [Clostridium]|uniref:DNA-binding transcriptional repressor AcrR n=4 Tax=Clostridium TaxID=1485 RepID=D8GT28_CLOLD|nr:MULTISPECIES: TetR/AcrR family transcriptional regulator [Clostridium]ADK16627.1 predicted transcriptional regulator [Clostridium ljungdahlii DSM 13528]AGY75718.1 TetR/AcrR family transcriptional regulator [Clostridium autoethanogenum DSM 10061]ALU35882.1 Transcriptional regulator TetR family [Clostridium autoethanogenum DSM 10061]OAA89504.1 DNA-binding transcriptional repressor AcrR [Clostridium ljungdahlii DSM 13528]OAA92689.1 DNA-binding transcriptional repressor AcrR [Clostridium coskat
MDKEKYHHGNLKEEMIKKGIELLTNSGYEDFSLRKVAKMCSVSHTAPYKHFKNKDELISAIIMEVSKSFENSLNEIVNKYPSDPKKQLVELGKQYVKFMIENPDYFKFIFLSDFSKPVNISKDDNSSYEGGAFQVFKASAINYLKSVYKNTIEEKDLSLDILTMWSAVHGISVLLLNNSIKYDGDCIDLVDKMLNEKIIKIYDTIKLPCDSCK